jgi:ketosteroid isomerase-like protein
MRRELRGKSTAWRNKKAGKVCETRKVDVWRFRDGRAIEFYEYFDTTKLIQLRRSSPIG